MLEEHEWEKVGPLLSGAIQKIKYYLEGHDASAAQARDESFALSSVTSKAGVE